MEKVVGVFLFCVTLLGTFALCVNTMPKDFFSPEEREEIEYLTQWKAGELFFSNITDYDNQTITRTLLGDNPDFYIADFDCHIGCVWRNANPEWIILNHWWYQWWIFKDTHYLKPDLTRTYILDHVQEDNENISSFSLSCDCYTYALMVTYNESKFSSLSDAFDGIGGGGVGELYLYIGLGYEERPATISAWTLIAQLMLFQMPDVHPLINAFIAIPLWACVAIVAFILITRAIPLLGG